MGDPYDIWKSEMHLGQKKLAPSYLSIPDRSSPDQESFPLKVAAVKDGKLRSTTNVDIKHKTLPVVAFTKNGIAWSGSWQIDGMKKSEVNGESKQDSCKYNQRKIEQDWPIIDKRFVDSQDYSKKSKIRWSIIATMFFS